MTTEDEAVMARFRKLPEIERERIIDLATDRLGEVMEKFMTAAMNLEGFSAEAKREAIESIYGPLNQTEEEAIKDDSQFSKSFDAGIIVTILQIMKEENR